MATKKVSVKISEEGVVTGAKGLYDGTLRVVTEADILGDPRLVSASVVVGQLYDFSNLPYIKDGVIEAEVEAKNEVKAKAEVLAETLPATPPFTSEAERTELKVKFPDMVVVEPA